MKGFRAVREIRGFHAVRKIKGFRAIREMRGFQTRRGMEGQTDSRHNCIEPISYLSVVAHYLKKIRNLSWQIYFEVQHFVR